MMLSTVIARIEPYWASPSKVGEPVEGVALQSDDVLAVSDVAGLEVEQLFVVVRQREPYRVNHIPVVDELRGGLLAASIHVVDEDASHEDPPAVTAVSAGEPQLHDDLVVELLQDRPRTVLNRNSRESHPHRANLPATEEPQQRRG